VPRCNARIKPWQLLYWLWHRAQARGAADWVLAPPGILTLVATGEFAFAWTRTRNCRATPRAGSGAPWRTR
jgi:hypothetical protein